MEKIERVPLVHPVEVFFQIYSLSLFQLRVAAACQWSGMCSHVAGVSCIMLTQTRSELLEDVRSDVDLRKVGCQ
jgi:hypothetical protein